MHGAAPKTVLIVLNHIEWFWTHRLPLARAAQDAGWRVKVAVHGAEQDPKLRAEGFEGINLPPWRADLFLPLRVITIILALAHLFKRERPDLVHAITLKYSFMSGLAARLHGGQRMVCTIAGRGYLFSKTILAGFLRVLCGPLMVLAFRHPRTHLIFQNPDDRAALIAAGCADPTRTHLILGSGVDVGRFTPAPEPQNTPPMVVMATRLVREKGVGVFIEAARLLKQRGFSVRCVLAGGLSPSNPSGLNAHDMEALNQDHVIEWRGHVENIAALYAQSNLVLYPSYYNEGIPKVLLEAAACGRAIITTDHPGCREVVAHGENGLLVPIRDPQATADAIQDLLADPARRTVMGSAGRARALTLFDAKEINRQTLDVYTQALR